MLGYRLLLKGVIIEFIRNTRSELNADFDKFTNYKEYNAFKTQISIYKRNISKFREYEFLLEDLRRLKCQINLLEGKYTKICLKRKTIDENYIFGFSLGILTVCLISLIICLYMLTYYTPPNSQNFY